MVAPQTPSTEDKNNTKKQEDHKYNSEKERVSKLLEGSTWAAVLMTDSAQGSGGREDAETKQPLFYTPSPLNVFGVDPKHFQKWLQVWDERRTFNDVQPSPDHPKKLNCVSPDFILRGAPPAHISSQINDLLISLLCLTFPIHSVA